MNNIKIGWKERKECLFAKGKIRTSKMRLDMDCKEVLRSIGNEGMN